MKARNMNGSSWVERLWICDIILTILTNVEDLVIYNEVFRRFKLCVNVSGKQIRHVIDDWNYTKCTVNSGYGNSGNWYLLQFWWRCLCRVIVKFIPIVRIWYKYLHQNIWITIETWLKLTTGFDYINSYDPRKRMW